MATTRLSNALSALDAAIEAMPTGRLPADPGLHEVWPDMARVCLRGWAAALRDDLATASSALTAARRTKSEALAVRRIEEAMWRLAASREKMRALFAIVFEIKVLERHCGEGVRFSVDHQASVARLRELAASHECARKLAQVWQAVEGHDALQRRNYLSHSLSTAASMPPLVFLDDVYEQPDGSERYGRSYLVPKVDMGFSLERGVLLARARASCLALFATLASATSLLARLIAEAGTLPGPAECRYARGDDGAWVLTSLCGVPTTRGK